LGGSVPCSVDSLVFARWMDDFVNFVTIGLVVVACRLVIVAPKNVISSLH